MSKRRFELIEGTSSKFWTVEAVGSCVITTWGRIGTAEQSKTNDFDSEAKAQSEFSKLIAEKVAKGYIESMEESGKLPASIQDYLHFRVWSGFYESKDSVQLVMESYEEGQFDCDQLERKQVSEWIEIELAKKAEQEESWEQETDCVRLTRAFEHLTAGGIIAIENAGYTIDDGWADFEDIAHSIWEPAGLIKSIRGGCFYHEQDLERAVYGGELYIAFSAITGDDSDNIKIAEEIIRTLRAHGLQPRWDGNPSERINLPMQWKRRLGSPADVSPKQNILVSFEKDSQSY